MYFFQYVKDHFQNYLNVENVGVEPTTSRMQI